MQALKNYLIYINEVYRSMKMKVLLLNGSPHQHGCTYTALNEIAEELKKNNIESEIFYVGIEAIKPCMACKACAKLGKCVVNDKVNEFVDKAAKADAFVFGSPVHYASASGIIVPFLDRVFYSAAMAGRDVFRHKPGTAIVCARRAGTTFSVDQLNKYFTISEMVVVGSSYWNQVHGNTPDEVRCDEEGMQTMRTLARNIAYVVKSFNAAGLGLPVQEERIKTNFIR